METEKWPKSEPAQHRTKRNEQSVILTMQKTKWRNVDLCGDVWFFASTYIFVGRLFSFSAATVAAAAAATVAAPGMVLCRLRRDRHIAVWMCCARRVYLVRRTQRMKIIMAKHVTHKTVRSMKWFTSYRPIESACAHTVLFHIRTYSMCRRRFYSHSFTSHKSGSAAAPAILLLP